MTEQYLISFESTHNAIAAGEVLEKSGALIIPTPREITASCGISILTSEKCIEQIDGIFNDIGLTDSDYAIYSVNSGKKPKYTFIKGKGYE